MLDRIRYYISAHSTSLSRYVLEQVLFLCFAWVPSILGVGIRAIVYKLILHSQGFAAIESGVRLGQPKNITLGRNVYIDQGVYLHACPGGIEIGDNSFVMHHAELHVYNFRQIPHAGIKIGRDCLIGEFCLIRGQGGVTIGDKVYLAPLVQILAVNHVFSDPTRPIIEQGITAEGIVVEDNVWIGAGAIITDGVRIGQGAVIGADGGIWIRSQHRVGRRSRENMIWPQVSLAQLAAMLHPDYSVEVVDAIAERTGWEDFQQLLRDKQPRYYVTQVTAPTLTNDMYGTLLARSGLFSRA